MKQDIYIVLRGAFPRPVVQLILHELALLQAIDDAKLHADNNTFYITKNNASYISSMMSFHHNLWFRYTLPIISNTLIMPDTELLPTISLPPQFISSMFAHNACMEQSMSRVLRSVSPMPANFEQRHAIYKNPVIRKASAADFGLPSKKEIAKRQRDTWRRK